MRVVKVSHSEAPDFCVIIPESVDDTDQFLDSVLHGAAGWSEAQEVNGGIEMAAVINKMMAEDSDKVADGLPEMCFSVNQTTGELILIVRGQSGYYPSDWSTKDKAKNEEIANRENGKKGITMAQRKAMEVGSAFGWHLPGADPKNPKYTKLNK